MADGSEHRADLVISAADGHAVIFEMLGGKYINDEIAGYYRDLPIFPPIIQISLGVNRDFSGEPHMVTYDLKQPVMVAGESRDTLSVKHFCYDPTMAPAGKSALVINFKSNYDYWKNLSREPDRYRAEKERIAEVVTGALEQRFPGIKEQIEVERATGRCYFDNKKRILESKKHIQEWQLNCFSGIIKEKLGTGSDTHETVNPEYKG